MGLDPVDTYRRAQGKYATFASDVARILSKIPTHEDDIHKIEDRAKDVDSFAKKCAKRQPDGTPKYTDPLSQITDLSGVRVIVFVPDAVPRVCQYIEQNFQVVEQRDVGEERFASGHFGYQSIHFLVRLTPGRLSLPDFKDHADLTCEIQVRTVLQHAWAEIEHDIRYKSQDDLPTNMERRFLSLAGMLEIADREFQSIQDEDARLKQNIKASLEADLTKTAIAESSMGAGGDAPSPGVPAGATGVPGRARDFVAAGQYDDAIELYSQMLADKPSMHTLYIGRAKARFLAGDQRGALSDLQLAKNLEPTDLSVESVRRQFVDGRVSVPREGGERHGTSDLVREGNLALADARGEEAFVAYSQAQQGGYNFVFSSFNKGMACVLARDFAGAEQILEPLRPIPGTPMEINLLCLRGILGILRGTAGDSELEALHSALSAMPEFNYSISPLRHLESGLIKQGGAPGRVMAFFDEVRVTSIQGREDGQID
jgi:ppGpp synthetase/RelA/SpoT-type nucleotidyltranferase